ncbi:hypothetical protein DIE09_28980, partial [Burkholderia sp. Bp9010]
MDSDATELSVELRPVDSDVTLLAVDVDNDVSELLVELRLVDSEPIELVADDRPVEVEVDSELIELVAEDRPVDVEVESDATVRVSTAVMIADRRIAVPVPSGWKSQ